MEKREMNLLELDELENQRLDSVSQAFRTIIFVLNSWYLHIIQVLRCAFT